MIKDTTSEPPEPTEAEENRMPQRLKRKYTRRTGIPTLEQTASGGAVNIDDQQAF